MLDSSNVSKSPSGFSDAELFSILDRVMAPDATRLKKVLILPPDFTRYHSGAGKITAHYYNMLKDSCQVDILPALGSHAPVTEAECRDMYLGQVPWDRLIVHNWRTDVVRIGEVPRAFVREVSGGLVDESIAVEVNRLLLDPSYDLILSIGQVVPHEVVGMANRNKNLFVGVGGSQMINSTHMLSAFYGIEKVLGLDHSPVRRVFDYAEEQFLSKLPVNYILTVTTEQHGDIRTHGLFIGRDRKFFEEAVALSQEINITQLDGPIQKAVVYLDPREYKATWVGNKAIYRTRMALADGGELLILAPGVSMYCEDAQNDALIAKYGYCGTKKVLDLCKNAQDIQENLSVAGHRIHGSSEGRFKVTYATKCLDEAGVRKIGYDYMPYDQAVCRYDVQKLVPGYNTMPDGEVVYFIGNPALGLWMDKSRLS